VAVDLSDLLRSQIGGSIRRQATPGLSPDSTFVGAGIPAMPLGIADVSNSHGINVRAGNRVLPNLAVEVQLEYMTGFEVEIPNFSQAPPPPAPPPDPAGAFVDDLNPATTADNVTYLRANDDDTIDVQLLTMTVNLKVPLLTGRIQPYGLIGGGAVFVFRDGRFPRRSDPPGATSEDPYKFEEYVNVRDVGSVFRIGGGIDTYVSENIFVSVEGTWVAAQGEAMNDLRYASITFGVGYRF
jgi:opacity protein-like surface antigen